MQWQLWARSFSCKRLRVTGCSPIFKEPPRFSTKLKVLEGASQAEFLVVVVLEVLWRPASPGTVLQTQGSQ
jgi:hypothetical protein